MPVLIALGGGGGVCVLLTAIMVVGRGVFRQVGATEDNTKALKELTGQVDALFQRLSDHETRIAVLEDRIIR